MGSGPMTRKLSIVSIDVRRMEAAICESNIFQAEFAKLSNFECFFFLAKQISLIWSEFLTSLNFHLNLAANNLPTY